MNSDCTTVLRDFRTSLISRGIIAFIASVMAILSIWSANNGIPWGAPLCGIASIMSAIGVWEMTRTRLTFYTDHLEYVAGLLIHRRIDRAEIVSIHRGVGYGSAVRLRDGAIVTLTSPGGLPDDVFRYLRQWFRPLENCTEQ